MEVQTLETFSNRILYSLKKPAKEHSLKGRIVDLTFALLLIMLVSPVLAIICILVLLRNGRPILYRGTRLGRNKKLFTIYKIRTLVPNAQQILGSNLLGNKNDLVTPLGNFLRSTRLDELPQLFNVITGDMELIGPRPVRPEVYKKVARQIPGYDRRFEVRPGLIGPSQLFTSHGCPKLIRTIIDNRFVQQKRSIGRKLYFLWVTMLAVTRMILRKLQYGEKPEFQNSTGINERRKERRIYPLNANAYTLDFSDGEDYKHVGKINDINLESFRVKRSQPLKNPNFELAKLETEIGKAGSHTQEKRLVFVKCGLNRHCHTGEVYDYVWNYRPISILGHFVIHQYFLGESLAKLD